MHEIQHRDLLTHLEIFHNEQEADFDELIQRLNGIQLELKYPLHIVKLCVCACQIFVYKNSTASINGFILFYWLKVIMSMFFVI